MKTKALVKFDFDVAVIATLDAKYKDIEITDGKSYAVVMQGLAEYRELRLAIDDKHKEYKKDILEAGRSLDGDKNRLKGLLEPGENHLKEIRQVEDDRKAAIKAEKDRKERERIEAIQEKINAIRNQGMVHGGNSSTIRESLIILRAMKISKEIYQELTDQAIECRNVAMDALEEFLSRALQFEKEEVERKAEAERLEALRKKLEIVQKKANEEKREIKENRKKFEETERKAKLKKEQEEFERQATIKAETEAQEKAKAAERNLLAREEAEAKEKQRKAEMAPDKEKLMALADSLFTLPYPTIKTGEPWQILIWATEQINKLAEEIKKKAQEL